MRFFSDRLFGIGPLRWLNLLQGIYKSNILDEDKLGFKKACMVSLRCKSLHVSTVVKALHVSTVVYASTGPSRWFYHVWS
jgi:hypothetical protein